MPPERNIGEPKHDHNADVRQKESQDSSRYEDDMVVPGDRETSKNESQVGNENKEIADKFDVHKDESEGMHKAHDGVVSTGDGESSKQDCEDRYEFKTKGQTEIDEENMEIKIDPVNLSLKDEEGVKEEIDSESEDIGEIPFFEEEYETNSHFQGSVAIPSSSHELNMDNRVNRASGDYRCETCSKCFPTKNRLNTHKKIHLEKKPFVCDYCGKDFAQKGNLRTHEKTVHLRDGWIPYRTESKTKDLAEFDEKNVEVKVDPYNISLEGEGIKEEPDSESADLREIPFVEEVYAENDNFSEPVSISGLKPKVIEDGSENDIEVKIENYESSQLTNQRSKLTGKKFRGHTDWKPYRTESECGKPKCKKCGSEFSNARNLKIHIRNVHILKLSGPERTTKKLKRVRTEVLEECTGTKPLSPIKERTCIICGIVFEKARQMKLHLLKHTKAYKNLNVNAKVLRSDGTKSAKCLECGIILKNSNIRPHIANVHYKLINTLDLNNMDNYDLSEGGTALVRDGTAQRREKTMQTFLCEFCEKVFNDFDRSNLNKHIRYVHEGIRQKKKEGKWLCEYCDKQFNDPKGMKKHKKFKHEGFGCECDICGYIAVTLQGLMKHKSGKHGIKMLDVPVEMSSSSYQCMECGKFYSSPSVLKTHMLIHTDQWPFECDQCDQKFRQKPTLELHRKRKHTEKMPHSTDVSGISFTTRDAQDAVDEGEAAQKASVQEKVGHHRVVQNEGAQNEVSQDGVFGKEVAQKTLAQDEVVKEATVQDRDVQKGIMQETVI